MLGEVTDPTLPVPLHHDRAGRGAGIDVQDEFAPFADQSFPALHQLREQATATARLIANIRH